MRRTFQNLLLILISAVLISAGIFIPRIFNSQTPYQRSEYIMGTIFDITVVEYGEDVSLSVEKAFGEIRRIDRMMNRYDEQSEVSLVNANAGIEPVKVSSEMIDVLEAAIKASEMSDGVFDITIGPVSELWGIDDEKKIVPDDAKIKELIKYVDYRNIVVDKASSTVYLMQEGMKIDLGGIAKGYSLSRAMKIFMDSGVKNVLVNAGGNISTRGDKKIEIWNLGIRDGRRYARGGSLLLRPWTIGIQDPRNETGRLGDIEVSDTSISTSGDYQRYFIKDSVRYHHIIDPKTGYPSRGLISVTLVGENEIFTDAMSTAVFISGKENGMALMRKSGLEGVIVDESGEIMISDGLRDRLNLTR